MLTRALAVGILALAFASPALAGSKVIVTPSMALPPGGSLTCSVVNGSASKDLVVWISVRSTSGGLIVPAPSLASLGPLKGAAVTPGGLTGDGHCVLTLESGSLKDARVSLYVRDAGGVIRAWASVP